MECSWDKYLEVQEELDKLPAEDVLAVLDMIWSIFFGIVMIIF